MHAPASLKTLLYFGLFSLIASGCASLNEQECRSGDWQTIGYRDGQNGRTLKRFDEHREACTKFNIEPNQDAYRVGRERGLNFYCTPANGLAVGRRGEHYAGVCPDWSEFAFLSSYEIGRDVYSARQRIERLESHYRELDARLRRSSNKEEIYYLSGQLSRLRMERDFAWDDLRRREERATRSRY